jgi:hypothetical protein
VTRAELHRMVDELPENAVDGAGVLLRGIIEGPLDPDQAWFWTSDWQRKEARGRGGQGRRERRSL